MLYPKSQYVTNVKYTYRNLSENNNKDSQSMDSIFQESYQHRIPNAENGDHSTWACSSSLTVIMTTASGRRWSRPKRKVCTRESPKYVSGTFKRTRCSWWTMSWRKLSNIRNRIEKLILSSNGADKRLKTKRYNHRSIFGLLCLNIPKAH